MLLEHDHYLKISQQSPMHISAASLGIFHFHLLFCMSHLHCLEEENTKLAIVCAVISVGIKEELLLLQSDQQRNRGAEFAFLGQGPRPSLTGRVRPGS